jgi:hypothetical protein
MSSELTLGICTLEYHRLSRQRKDRHHFIRSNALCELIRLRLAAARPASTDLGEAGRLLRERQDRHHLGFAA